jgi:LPXTG-site transpeptidase (sortase) family protein
MFITKLSNLLILSGIIIIVLTFYPVFKEELIYWVHRSTHQEFTLAERPDQVAEIQRLQRTSSNYSSSALVPVSFAFSLVIPNIGVNSVVFPKINSGDPQEYLPVLKKGVAHALGSSLPNEKGVVYIFAHSTDAFYNIGQYNAVFFLLNKLNSGDEVYIFFEQQKYTYKVSDKRIIDPIDVSETVANLKGNYLVLQTCWPPGTTLKRLLVIASKT